MAGTSMPCGVRSKRMKKRHRPFTYHVSAVAPMNNEPSVMEFTSGTWKALWLSTRRKSRNHGTQPVGHSTVWKHSWGSWQWISGPGAYGDATSNDMSRKINHHTNTKTNDRGDPSSHQCRNFRCKPWGRRPAAKPCYARKPECRNIQAAARSS